VSRATCASARTFGLGGLYSLCDRLLVGFTGRRSRRS
jgi:hypothetical protein